MKSLLLVITALFLAGCAAPAVKVTDTSCLWVRPIYIGKEDVLTTETASEILAHNDKWKENCK